MSCQADFCRPPNKLAWCMLYNDKVSFRMQWPQYAHLQINDIPLCVINRPGSQLLGANGRDDGPIITPYTQGGSNKISLTVCDARVFCLGVRIVKRCTLQQILNLVPKEGEGEKFEDALARVRRCVGGGAATENAKSDDLEVVSDSIPVNLRCHLSGSRMKIAGRFKECAHMGCFDLEVFIEMNQRSRKWQCPICLKNYALENIVIDPYFTRITYKMRDCGKDVTKIEVKPNGSWRAKAEDDRKSLGELEQWHLPDGTLCAPTEVVSKPKPEVALKQVKLEGGSEGHNTGGLKLGMKKNKNGIWEVKKPEINPHSLSLSSGSKLPMNNCHNHNHNTVIPMSRSATSSGKDGEDTIVNQEGGGSGGGRFHYAANNGVGLHLTTSARDAEVIVLSDSEDETENLVSSTQMYKNNNNNTYQEHGVAFSSVPLSEDPSLVAGVSSCLGLFNIIDDDLGVPFGSSLTGYNHMGSCFQLFGSDAVDLSGTLVDVHHGPLNCSTLMGGGSTLGAETSMGSAPFTPDSLHHQSDINDDLVDNPLTFGNNDPPFQLFDPTRPTETTQHQQHDVPLTSQPSISNGFRSDDWTSLRLGGGVGEHETAATNGLNSRTPPPLPKDGGGALDSIVDTASLLLGMRDGRFEKKSKERSDSPLSFSRQKRSVKPRLSVSIDSDSGDES